MEHKLYDIWPADDFETNPFPWCAKMHNFIAHFKTDEQAKRYIKFVKEYRGEIPRDSSAVYVKPAAKR